MEVSAEEFRDEFKILEHLKHRHVAAICELLHDDDHYFIVSEYFEPGIIFDCINRRIDKGKSTDDIIKKVAQ